MRTVVLLKLKFKRHYVLLKIYFKIAFLPHPLGLKHLFSSRLTPQKYTQRTYIIAL